MNILIFAPHPDDEVIGCGGTIARYVSNGDTVNVCIVTRGKPPIFNHPAETIEDLPHDLFNEIKASHEILGVTETYYLEFPAVMLETIPRYELNNKVLELISELKPDIVYMPHFGDMQKDHMLTAEAIMVAVRPKGNHIVQYVYSYETLSETEWNIPHAANAFMPNSYVNISDYINIKHRAMNCYQSQLSSFPNPRSIEAMEALAKYRGSTMGARAAEAFMLIREYRK